MDVDVDANDEAALLRAAGDLCARAAAVRVRREAARAEADRADREARAWACVDEVRSIARAYLGRPLAGSAGSAGSATIEGVLEELRETNDEICARATAGDAQSWRDLRDVQYAFDAVCAAIHQNLAATIPRLKFPAPPPPSAAEVARAEAAAAEAAAAEAAAEAEWAEWARGAEARAEAARVAHEAEMLAAAEELARAREESSKARAADRREAFVVIEPSDSDSDSDSEYDYARRRRPEIVAVCSTARLAGLLCPLGGRVVGPLRLDGEGDFT